MALTEWPTIRFNNSTGSDTAASGAGPATAVTGTAAAHTNGVASTTITFADSPDLSGVAQDGSALLFLNTASGRKFTRISTVDNSAKTCVVEDSFNIASGSAVNYAIGGKRATLNHADSRKLFYNGGDGDCKGGVRVEIEYTGTNYILTSANGGKLQVQLAATTNGAPSFVGTGATRPTVEQQGSGADCFSFWGSAGAYLQNLQITHTGASRGILCANWGGGSTPCTLVNCKFSGGSLGLYGSTPWIAIGCEFTGFSTAGGAVVSAGTYVNFWDCYVHDNTAVIYQDAYTLKSAYNTAFIRNAKVAEVSSTYGIEFNFANCVFAFGSATVLKYTGTMNTDRWLFLRLHNCVFYGNTGYAVDWGSATGRVHPGLVMTRCAFGSNSSGNFPASPTPRNNVEPVTLTANPFVNCTASAGHDFRLNNLSEGGALLKRAGWPRIGFDQGNYAATVRDIGAVQHDRDRVVPRTRIVRR